MHPDKPLGPDGMNPAFYQRFWEIIGPDVVSCCQAWFEDGEVPA